jgi:hypothetical protein
MDFLIDTVIIVADLRAALTAERCNASVEVNEASPIRSRPAPLSIFRYLLSNTHIGTVRSAR